MPSRFEPCGQGQMIALRYGTPPVVHRTGGLADTVLDVGRDGTGFVHNAATPKALLDACRRAMGRTGRGDKEWAALQDRGMAIDWSWEAGPAEQYAAYRRAISAAPRAPRPALAWASSTQAQQIGAWGGQASVCRLRAGRRRQRTSLLRCPQLHATSLVVGTGAAGLTAALAAAERGASVLMLTKGHAPDSSSWHAQGGIAGRDRRRRHRGAARHRHGAGRPRPVPAERGPGPRRGGPRACPRADRAGRAVRSRAEPGGRPLAAPRLERGRRATGWAVTSLLGRRARDVRADRRRARPRPSSSLLVSDGRCLRRRHARGPHRGPGHDPGDGRRGGAVGPHHQPAGPDRRRRGDRPCGRARRSPTWSSCSSTRPSWRARGCC